ncbi:asparagine--tRNA ligase [Thermithiobacillus plumbiphilus]|uniref:Asparagine--tRNA ligase n=1 Tax=Thermithiobacillus plumbiphilus TaxID=1729899 RepID=A0ABU9D9F9_9PROT
MKAIECATKAGEMVWKGWVESVEDQPNGNKVVRIRGNNAEAILEVPRELAVEAQLTPQSVVETISVPRPGGIPLICDLNVLNRAEPLPADLIDPDFTDTRHRHLHIRTPQLRAAAMFRHFLQKYVREFLDGLGFYHVHTPILTEASCVCSGDVFAFPYYNKKIANLIQSPWMYADALVAGVERVYALNPSFRREREATNIHLVEIWQLQVDLAWASNEDVMMLEETLLKHLAREFLEKHQDLYSLAGLSSTHLADLLKPYERITYDESLDRLNALGHELPYGSDYSKEQSDALSATFAAPYFITNYPQELKNFWFPSYEASGKRLTPSNDLFAHTGHGEIIGGGARVHNAQELSENLDYFGHDQEEFDWFLETRRYGCPPHAGFSTGFDRLAALIMGVDHILKATLFPRLPNGTIRP